jgi:lysophospholipase L1-like esterase
MKFSLRKICSILSAYRRHKTRRVIDSTLTSEHWQERLNEFRRQPRTSGRIIFMGNSLTELFDLTILGDTTILNRGITGDFSEGLLKRLDEVISLKPSKLFLEVGINDLVEHVSVREVTNNYKKIVEQVRLKSPDTQIFIQSLLPVKMTSSFFTSSEDVNEVVKEQNKELKALASQLHVSFVNLYDNFVLSGEINPRLTWDGVHLVDEGYAIWKGLLAPCLQ